MARAYIQNVCQYHYQMHPQTLCTFYLTFSFLLSSILILEIVKCIIYYNLIESRLEIEFMSLRLLSKYCNNLFERPCEARKIIKLTLIAHLPLTLV